MAEAGASTASAATSLPLNTSLESSVTADKMNQSQQQQQQQSAPSEASAADLTDVINATNATNADADDNAAIPPSAPKRMSTQSNMHANHNTNNDSDMDGDEEDDDDGKDLPSSGDEMPSLVGNDDPSFVSNSERDSVVPEYSDFSSDEESFATGKVAALRQMFSNINTSNNDGVGGVGGVGNTTTTTTHAHARHNLKPALKIARKRRSSSSSIKQPAAVSPKKQQEAKPQQTQQTQQRPVQQKNDNGSISSDTTTTTGVGNKMQDDHPKQVSIPTTANKEDQSKDDTIVKPKNTDDHPKQVSIPTTTTTTTTATTTTATTSKVAVLKNDATSEDSVVDDVVVIDPNKTVLDDHPKHVSIPASDGAKDDTSFVIVGDPNHIDDHPKHVSIPTTVAEGKQVTDSPLVIDRQVSIITKTTEVTATISIEKENSDANPVNEPVHEDHFQQSSVPDEKEETVIVKYNDPSEKQESITTPTTTVVEHPPKSSTEEETRKDDIATAKHDDDGSDADQVQLNEQTPMATATTTMPEDDVAEKPDVRENKIPENPIVDEQVVSTPTPVNVVEDIVLEQTKTVVVEAQPSQKSDLPTVQMEERKLSTSDASLVVAVETVQAVKHVETETAEVVKKMESHGIALPAAQVYDDDSSSASSDDSDKETTDFGSDSDSDDVSVATHDEHSDDSVQEKMKPSAVTSAPSIPSKPEVQPTGPLQAPSMPEVQPLKPAPSIPSKPESRSTNLVQAPLEQDSDDDSSSSVADDSDGSDVSVSTHSSGEVKRLAVTLIKALPVVKASPALIEARAANLPAPVEKPRPVSASTKDVPVGQRSNQRIQDQPPPPRRHQQPPPLPSQTKPVIDESSDDSDASYSSDDAMEAQTAANHKNHRNRQPNQFSTFPNQRQPQVPPPNRKPSTQRQIQEPQQQSQLDNSTTNSAAPKPILKSAMKAPSREVSPQRARQEPQAQQQQQQRNGSSSHSRHHQRKKSNRRHRANTSDSDSDASVTSDEEGDIVPPSDRAAAAFERRSHNQNIHAGQPPPKSAPPPLPPAGAAKAGMFAPTRMLSPLQTQRHRILPTSDAPSASNIRRNGGFENKDVDDSDASVTSDDEAALQTPRMGNSMQPNTVKPRLLHSNPDRFGNSAGAMNKIAAAAAAPVASTTIKPVLKSAMKAPTRIVSPPPTRAQPAPSPATLKPLPSQDSQPQPPVSSQASKIQSRRRKPLDEQPSSDSDSDSDNDSASGDSDSSGDVSVSSHDDAPPQTTARAPTKQKAPIIRRNAPVVNDSDDDSDDDSDGSVTHQSDSDVESIQTDSDEEVDVRGRNGPGKIEPAQIGSTDFEVELGKPIPSRQAIPALTALPSGSAAASPPVSDAARPGEFLRRPPPRTKSSDVRAGTGGNFARTPPSRTQSADFRGGGFTRRPPSRTKSGSPGPSVLASGLTGGLTGGLSGGLAKADAGGPVRRPPPRTASGSLGSAASAGGPVRRPPPRTKSGSTGPGSFERRPPPRTKSGVAADAAASGDGVSNGAMAALGAAAAATETTGELPVEESQPVPTRSMPAAEGFSRRPPPRTISAANPSMASFLPACIPEDEEVEEKDEKEVILERNALSRKRSTEMLATMSQVSLTMRRSSISEGDEDKEEKEETAPAGPTRRPPPRTKSSDNFGGRRPPPRTKSRDLAAMGATDSTGGRRPPPRTKSRDLAAMGAAGGGGGRRAPARTKSNDLAAMSLTGAGAGGLRSVPMRSKSSAGVLTAALNPARAAALERNALRRKQSGDMLHAMSAATRSVSRTASSTLTAVSETSSSTPPTVSETPEATTDDAAAANNDGFRRAPARSKSSGMSGMMSRDLSPIREKRGAAGLVPLTIGGAATNALLLSPDREAALKRNSARRQKSGDMLAAMSRATASTGLSLGGGGGGGGRMAPSRTKSGDGFARRVPSRTKSSDIRAAASAFTPTITEESGDEISVGSLSRANSQAGESSDLHAMAAGLRQQRSIPQT